MNRYASLALALCAVTAAACGDQTVQNITGPVTGAAVKFVNVSVGSPGVNFFAGTSKVTAISSTSCQPPNDTTSTCRTNGVESTTGTGFAALGNGGLYNSVTPGTVTLAGKIAAATDNGLDIGDVSAQLVDGKFYSFYLSGVYNTTTKKADAFVIEDPVPPAPDTLTYVRLVNAIAGSQPMALTIQNTTTNATSVPNTGVAYKAAGAFTAVPAGVYNLTGNSTGAVPVASNISLVAGHVYTVVARGDPSSTVTANKPAFIVFANR